MRRTALFVCWCRPDLIRPRTVQVGRVAKGLRARFWKLPLVCATFENESDLFDLSLERLYGASYSSVTQLVDLDHYSKEARRRFDRAAEKAGAPPVQNWADAVSDHIERWMRFRFRPLAVSFAQPWECHLAVLKVKKKNPRLRWIAHFSDPWADSPYLSERPDIQERALADEGAVIEAADRIVFVTGLTADLTMRKYPAAWRQKAVVIPHTTDRALAELFADSPKQTPRFRLTHTGTLYSGQRSSEGLFLAIRDLRSEGVIDGNFELRMVGDMPSQVERGIHELGIQDLVSWTTPLYFQPSLAEMNDADVLLVIDANFDSSPFLPSKLFDYLIFDRPIFGITPPGSATSAFLQELGYPAASPSDVVGIKKTITALVKEWRAGQLRATKAHNEARRKYDLHVIAERYSELFKRV